MGGAVYATARRIIMYYKQCIVACSLLSLCLIAYGSDVGDSFFGNQEKSCDVEGDCTDAQTGPGGQPSKVKIDTDNGDIYVIPSDSVENSGHREGHVPQEINLIMTFSNAVNNHNLQKQFTQTVSSIFHHASVPLAIHIIGEEHSRKLATDIIKNNAGNAKFRMVDLDIDQMASDLDEVVKPMQHHFSSKPGAYYSHVLFFLSIGIHRVMHETMDKVIMLDADLKFTDDIKKLYDQFALFTDDNIIGIGRELQPVYRHTFWEYRQQHPGTRVGEPPPNGLTGFNSGVLLLNLAKMRQSTLYNLILTADAVGQLTKEFHFKGHLGDQDLFTLLSMKYEELFYILPCTWNRQLCTWWKAHGYESVFDDYFNCDGDVKLWHGNCNTPIP